MWLASICRMNLLTHVRFAMFRLNLNQQVLHCDPHKGNLLRTTDGKLCILDWGMTLEVPRDLQYALLEFIAQ